MISRDTQSPGKSKPSHAAPVASNTAPGVCRNCSMMWGALRPSVSSGNGRFLPQPLLHSRHGCVGGKEHQRVTGSCFDESDELGSQLIKVHPYPPLSGGAGFVEGRAGSCSGSQRGWRNGFHDTVSLLQSCLRFETAGNHCPPPWCRRSERTPDSGCHRIFFFHPRRDITGRGAQHGAACANIFGSVKIISVWGLVNSLTASSTVFSWQLPSGESRLPICR